MLRRVGDHPQREARKVLRRGARLLEGGALEDNRALVLFEVDGALIAVAALDWLGEPDIGLIGAIGIAHTLHGAEIEDGGGRLSRVVLQTCLQWLADAGCTQAVAEVHVDHGRSKKLLSHLNFSFQSMIDDNYELHAVSL